MFVVVVNQILNSRFCTIMLLPRRFELGIWMFKNSKFNIPWNFCQITLVLNEIRKNI
jgi:hypothetical protein